MSSNKLMTGLQIRLELVSRQMEIQALAPILGVSRAYVYEIVMDQRKAPKQRERIAEWFRKHPAEAA